MTRRFYLAWMVFPAMALLAGCVTSSSSPVKQKASPHKAAMYNTQLAIIYMQEGRMDLAQNKLAEALKQAPHLVDVHNAMALYYERIGRVPAANHQYKLALRYGDDDPNTLNNYGAFLCRQGKYRESIRYFVKASNNIDYSTPDRALSNAGLCALKIPDKTLAKKYFQQALAINNDLGQALWQMGMLSFQDQDYIKANNYLARLINVTQHPSARMLWVAIEAAWASGHQKNAEHYGRELLKRHPDSQEAQKFIQLVGSGS
ncbi:MAG TPA: type IV pilus biogenesis/stability protein PilW [Gammaproteobacteria bacterium]|nr:type IV pilus biogenesis/stability protein PilW [Gammaproteobacteria bacterium]